MRISRYSHLNIRLNVKNFKFGYFEFFVTCLVSKGLFLKAYNLFFSFIERLRHSFKFSNFEIFFHSIFDSKRPLLALLKRKRAANRYEIPTHIRNSRSKALIVHWFIKCAKARTEFLLVDRLYYEFIDFYNNVGRTIKKINDHYETALKNRAFMDKFKKRYRKFRYLRKKKFGF